MKILNKKVAPTSIHQTKSNFYDKPNIQTILGICLAGGMILAILQSKNWVGFSKISFPELLMHLGFWGALLGNTLILVVSAAVSWVFIRVILRQKTLALWAAFIVPIIVTWIIVLGTEILHSPLKTQGAESSNQQINRGNLVWIVSLQLTAY